MRSAGSSEYNYKNPIWRDVVSTGGAGDNVTIRFRVSILFRIYDLDLSVQRAEFGRQTDNPGPWFLHCHIDPHIEEGLAMVMVEGTPSAIETSNAKPGKCTNELRVADGSSFARRWVFQRLGTTCARLTTLLV